MNKFLFTSFLFFIILTSQVLSLNEIIIPTGKSITVDGGFSNDEWTDADSTAIELSNGSKIMVLFKHDTENLYFAFCSNLWKGMLMRCPEVMFDINNDKATSWQSDDWWFHASATDCYSKGIYGDYTTCKPTQPDWEANNMMDSDFKDTIEMKIPFNTIDVEPKNIVKFGICFDGTDTQQEWEYWPSGANHTNPSTWAEATINFNNSDVTNDENMYINFDIYPNPASDKIIVNNNNQYLSTIQIFTSEGIKMLQTEYSDDIDISTLPSGLYFLKIGNDKELWIRKFVILR